MLTTEHAKHRLRKRCKLPKKAVDRNVDKVLNNGVKHSECSGSLKRYVDYLFLSHGKGANIRLYGNYVYIFTRSRLVTVIPLPNKYRDRVAEIVKSRDKDKVAEDIVYSLVDNKFVEVPGEN